MDTPPPVLETARLILRPPVPGDAAAIARMNREERAFHAPTSPVRPAEFFEEDHWREKAGALEEERKAGRGLALFLFLHEAPLFPVGHAGLSNIVRSAFHAAHLGYSLREAYQGKGLMTEALEAVVRHAFGPMNLHRLMANHMPDNVRSARVLERLGFEREGKARAYLNIAGRWEDHILTARVNPLWQPTGLSR